MFRSLKIRLALSHTLPLLVILPLLGLSLVYLLESRYFLGNMASELVTQGELIAEFARKDPALWQDPVTAESFLSELIPLTAARLTLTNSQGEIIASSLAEDQNRIGSVVRSRSMSLALQGQTDWRVDYSANLGEQVVDVAVPVFDRQGSILGVIGLSRSLSEIEARLGSLRWLVAITILVITSFGLIIGLFLAWSIGAPLSNLNRAVDHYEPDALLQSVPETGPVELKNLAHTFNLMAQRLHELERRRQLMVAGIVHELGRPLGAIKVGVQALLDGAYTDPDLSVELAAGIDSQVNQLRRVIDDLTLLEESSFQELSLRRQSVNLLEIIQAQCQTHALRAKQKEISLDCETEGQYLQLFADPDRLSQILSNLIHNAIKYSRANDRVTISVEQEGPSRSPTHILVRVRDTGPGIEPEEQEKIFDLYYRNLKQKRIHEGMGIGLALARRMAEAHGGTLTVESVPGEGATFTLRLPVETDPISKQSLNP